MKKVKTFQLKIVIFAAVKYRCILHGNVYVMLLQGVQRRTVLVVNCVDFLKLLFFGLLSLYVVKAVHSLYKLQTASGNDF